MVEKTEEFEYEYLILLQPTSPIRSSKHVDNSIEKFERLDVDTLISIKSVRENPNWMKIINEDGYLIDLFKTKNISKNIFIVNGAIYLANMNYFLENKTFISNRTTFFMMDEYSSIDIDTKFDFDFAEYVFKRFQ